MSQESSQSSSLNSKKVFIGTAIILAGIAVAFYALYPKNKHIEKKKTKENGKNINLKKSKSQSNVVEKKQSKTLFNPSDIHFALVTEDGFNYCHVAADTKNSDLRLKYGSRLTHIGDESVINLPFEDILRKLRNINEPVSFNFQPFPELEEKWKQADNFKSEANKAYQAKDYDKAIEECSKAIELHPTNKVYYSNRILMYLAKKDYDNAWKDCEKIETIDPLSTYLKGHYLRGLVLFYKQQYQQAINSFEIVLQADPNCKESTVARDRLKQCKEKLQPENNNNEGNNSNVNKVDQDSPSKNN